MTLKSPEADIALKAIVNPGDCVRLMAADKLFSAIHSQYGPPPNWSRPQGFVSLSRIILEQQVSLASAQAHFEKLKNYLPAFTPYAILEQSDAELLQCQISRQKAAYLRALSSAILEGSLDLEQLSDLGEEEAKAKLTSIKGIGVWTSDIYLMFCLQYKDIFPLGDIAVVNTVKELTDAETREEIQRLSEDWRPLRSLAAYYLWHYYLRKRGRKSS
jgi:DNA-3-methyladenine glycosylase II